MSVKIRLTRMGRKKRPFYRIVVMDSRSSRDGGYIECLGTYDSISNPVKVRVEEERANYWLDRGAIPSDTVKNILQRQGVFHKRFLLKKGFDTAQIDEEMKKWEVLQIERQRRQEATADAKKKKRAEKKAASESEEVKEEAKVEAKEEVKEEAKVEAKEEVKEEEKEEEKEEDKE